RSARAARASAQSIAADSACPPASQRPKGIPGWPSLAGPWKAAKVEYPCEQSSSSKTPNKKAPRFTGGPGERKTNAAIRTSGNPVEADEHGGKRARQAIYPLAEILSHRRRTRNTPLDAECISSLGRFSRSAAG